MWPIFRPSRIERQRKDEPVHHGQRIRRLHHKQPVSVRKLAQRGSLKSAKKIGGVWLIDKEEQYPDHRRSGSVKSFEMVRGMYLVDEIAYVEGLHPPMCG